MVHSYNTHWTNKAKNQQFDIFLLKDNTDVGQIGHDLIKHYFILSTKTGKNKNAILSISFITV